MEKILQTSFDPRDIHLVLIGHQDKILDYRILLEMLRFNFSFSDKIWITVVYNGDPNGLPSGIGENTFILLKENSGYACGALDGFNAGLSFAAAAHRPIVLIFNFDVWFYTENGFKLLVEEFIESGKQFGAGYIPDLSLPMTDCMIFRKEFLRKILPIEDSILSLRENDLKLKEMYKGTQLGFKNMEEWMLSSIVKTMKDDKELSDKTVDDIWYKFQRDGAPRYRYTEKYNLTHEHDSEERKKMLKKFNVKNGVIITKFLNGEFG